MESFPPRQGMKRKWTWLLHRDWNGMYSIAVGQAFEWNGAESHYRGKRDGVTEDRGGNGEKMRQRKEKGRERTTKSERKEAATGSERTLLAISLSPVDNAGHGSSVPSRLLSSAFPRCIFSRIKHHPSLPSIIDKLHVGGSGGGGLLLSPACR